MDNEFDPVRRADFLFAIEYALSKAAKLSPRNRPTGNYNPFRAIARAWASIWYRRHAGFQKASAATLSFPHHPHALMTGSSPQEGPLSQTYETIGWTDQVWNHGGREVADCISHQEFTREQCVVTIVNEDG